MLIDSFINEIDKLCVEERLLLIETTVRSLRNLRHESLQHAVDVLHEDYITDKELTIFTNLDFENFYETR